MPPYDSDQAPKQNFGLRFIAINGALPFVMSFGLTFVKGGWLQLAAFGLCVVILFILNLQLARYFPAWRLLIWLVQALNVLAAGLLGSVAMVTAIPLILLLLMDV